MQSVDEMIPQRYPFQMIDRFLAIEPGKSAKALKLVTINEWYFRQPTQRLAIPRPILLEMLAQTGTAALLTVPEYEGKTIFFGGIKQAEFSADCCPGDRLELTVELTKVRRQIGVGIGIVTCDGEVRCRAELIFAAQG
jgi:3-hydroxyacyl-[acyl-carrier-protein] dehydratase